MTATAPRPNLGSITAGQLTIDVSARDVRVAGELVELTNTEYRLLLVLAAQPMRTFTRRELLWAVWRIDTDHTKTRTLDHHVMRMRRKLSINGCRFLRLRWGVGYQLLYPQDAKP